MKCRVWAGRRGPSGERRCCGRHTIWVGDSPTSVVVRLAIDQISGAAPWFESAEDHPNRSAETSAQGPYASVLVGRCAPTIDV